MRRAAGSKIKTIKVYLKNLRFLRFYHNYVLFPNTVWHDPTESPRKWSLRCWREQSQIQTSTEEMKLPSAAVLFHSSAVAFKGTENMTVKPLKTRGSDYPLCDNQSLTVLLHIRNVCVCLSSICGGICFILCSPSVSAGAWRRHVVRMLFLSKHKAGISERRAYSLCWPASAMLGQKMKLCVMFINTWKRLSGMTLTSLGKAFDNHWEAQQPARQISIPFSLQPNNLTPILWSICKKAGIMFWWTTKNMLASADIPSWILFLLN